MITEHTLRTLPLADSDIKRLGTLNVSGICLDSRTIRPNELFVLLDGKATQAHKMDFIKAVSSFASAVLTEVDIDDEQILGLSLTLPIIYMPNLREHLGDFICAFLQEQQQADLPAIVAVTGTNGKTSISQLIAQLVVLSGHSSAVMGTAGNGRWGELEQSTHTTADVLAVHTFAHQLAEEKVDVLSLEASSHGLHQHRLQGLPITTAVFSNLSRDHLDYHSDMTQYGTAKARLFDTAYFDTLTYAIINNDDEFAKQLIARLQANKKLTVWTYSQDTKADFYAKSITPSLDGTVIDLVTPFGELSVKSPLLGLFNVANLLASIAGFLSLYPTKFALLPSLITALQGACGRMQRVSIDGHHPCVIVDYAHTPDALTQVLTSLKGHCQGKLWAVFGCGGDRDKGKRPLMTQAGLDVADRLVLTSDNPRTEHPMAILEEMQANLSLDDYAKIHIEPDRKQAIAYALAAMKPGDIVVVAGKGHETYQEINGVRYDFDDVAVIKALLESN